MQVSVSDKGIPKKSSTALVIMKVLEPRSFLSENETNTGPEIVGETLNYMSGVSVTENEMIGRMIAVMSASDSDGDVICTHLLPKGNEEGIFAVTEGALTVAQKIDYEKQPKFDLTLLVTDGIDYTYFNVSINTTIQIVFIPTHRSLTLLHTSLFFFILLFSLSTSLSFDHSFIHESNQMSLICYQFSSCSFFRHQHLMWIPCDLN